MTVAYIFPGQGSQVVGMGRDLCQNYPLARELFEQADQTLKMSLTRLCFEGPEDELRQTQNAQPALVTVSYACLKIAQGNLPPPAFVAGHSLGEYTALAAAGVLDFATAVYLARERGRLMHEAGQKQPGGMAAVLGQEEGKLASLCAETGTQLANINCPGQMVISGAEENLNRACETLKSGGSKVIRLPVSGAFHSPLMQPAAEGLAKVIASLKFRPATVPIIANASAKPVTQPEEIKSELLTQLCHSVQWQRSVEYMLAQGVDTFIEIGPGKVLTGLIKRINKDVKTLNIGDVAAIKALGG
ncbi:MAG: ACP S-malonyltransferase [Chloroflexota bacterium]